MGKILIIEDDEFFREALKNFLVSQKHEVDDAPNGKIGRDILAAARYDCVIADVQMPFFSGIELLEWARAKIPTPIILMTGFSNIIDAQKAHDLGAKFFLPKPFQNKDLLSAIDQVLKPNHHDTHESTSTLKTDYCKVSIEEFVARPEIDFDVFVRLSERKYIKIGYAGTTLPREQIQTYRAKGLKFLYIRRTDFSKLVRFNLEVSKLLKKTDKVSKDKKLAFMKYTGEVILEKNFIDGVNKESFDEAKDFMATTIEMITEDSQYLDLLNLLNSHSDYIYAKAVGTAMYSIMIARLLGHESQQTFFKLSLAGLFHDIDEKEIDPEILQKPRVMLSHSERHLIESHPARGRDILQAVKNVPSDVVQLVYEHHEDLQGQGYPRGLKRRDLHPLASIIQLATLFTEAALKGPGNPGRPGSLAIRHIAEVYLDRVDHEGLTALRKLFGVST